MLPEAEVHGVHDCRPEPRCECGAEAAVRGKPVRHQGFDIPPAAADVLDYRLCSGVCAGCGRHHRAALPAGVPSGHIGPRALVLIGVLAIRFHFTQLKIRDVLALMMGLDISVGAISQAHGKAAQSVRVFRASPSNASKGV